MTTLTDKRGLMLVVKFIPALFLLATVCSAQTCAPAEALRAVDSKTGSLSETNCRLSDGTLYAEYVIILPTHGEIELTAEPGDSVTLLLRDLAGRKVDAGTSIRRTLERGPYTVLVNSTSRNPAGTYTIRSSFLPEPRTLCRNFMPAGPNQTLMGRLTDSSCRLPDNSAFDGYLVTLFGAGTLEISMTSQELDSYLILRDDDGIELASDDNSGTDRNARIEIRVNGTGTYTIVAATATEMERGGAYQLSIGFRPDDTTCRPLASITGSQELRGRILASSCTFTANDFFNYYPLTLSEAGLAELRLSSSAFEARLVLLDASGRLIDSDPVLMRHQLAPGSYTVLVSSNGLPGDYTLQYIFRPGLPEICPVLSIEPGSSRTGSLSEASSCRTKEGMSDVYRLVMPSSGTLEITMSSGDFDSILVLRDDKDNRLAANNNSGDSTDSRILTDLPAGTYTIAAGSTGKPGGYNISYQVTPRTLPPCSKFQKLDLNTGYIGVLSSDSCRGKEGQLVDYYEFTTPSEGTVAAVMTSRTLDSFLSIEDTEGKTLRSDDNSYGGGDALIVQFLPARTYRLAARSANGEAGLYRLDLLFAAGGRPAGCAPLRSVAPGDSIRGRLDFTSCQYFDDTFADMYRLNVSETAQLDIRLEASEFDPILLLLDSKGNLLEQNDGGRLIRSLDPGIYYLVAKPFAEFSSAGAYSLVLQ